ncbi:MAG TPA: hypothetical protein EYM84_01285 [Flavobacteriales bacterium]|nr:hypothetical protein [Flavobacteriales bacterium]
MALDIDRDPQYTHVQKANKEYFATHENPLKGLFSNFVENGKNNILAVIGSIGALGLASAAAITATAGAPVVLPAVVGTLVLISLFIEKEDPDAPAEVVDLKGPLDEAGKNIDINVQEEVNKNALDSWHKVTASELASNKQHQRLFS